MSTRYTYPTDLRQIVNAILYQAKTGCQWRMLPHDFPPEGTVRDYFRRFKQNILLATFPKTEVSSVFGIVA
ncbi:hypothetical protein FACS1894170_02340 [Planctomycetales bacterium]|nr:hypothetical protein FACS1894170_02340 [Planctomycetales bacterium]